jgi:hypothetical protein
MPAITDAPAATSITVHWIKNNAIAALLSGLTSFLLYVLRNVTGAGETDAGFGAIAFMYLAATALWALYGGAGAVLSGAVLQRIVPHLPVWAWIALHVALMAAAGLVAEALQASPRPPAVADSAIAATFISGLIMGGLLGGVSGALEAFVLRGVASGTGSWIAWSAIAIAVTWSLLVVVAKAWDLGSDFGDEVLSEILNILTTVLAAVLMLPALGRLRSKTLSNVPRYFT